MIFTAIIYVCGVVLFIFITQHDDSANSLKEEMVLRLNDITKVAEENWDSLEVLEQRDLGKDYCVVDDLGTILYDARTVKSVGTDPGVSVEAAIKNRYPYSYVIINDRIAGNVILMDNGMNVIERLRNKVILGFVIGGAVLLLGIFFFEIYIQKNIISPFKKMEQFAGKVAEGNLDEPLLMDKENLFGAFSESFDIMREELSESKKRELALQKKERELVASLSHDLKTPITGIKITAELMKAKLTVAAEENDAILSDKREEGQENWTDRNNLTSDLIEKIDSIYQKVEQIDHLASDLFTTTLDDLGEFKVSCNDEEAKILAEIVKRYDDKNMVASSEIPDVIIHIDVKRMGQVIGNIISNSYKYAGTKIDVEYELEDQFLKMKLRDYGPGVPVGELELVTNKFYRGKQWVNSKEDGNGLGLYISKTLMDKMNGALVLESATQGLLVTLLIPLS